VSADRLSEWLVLGALGCLGGLGIGRGLLLAARGVRVLAVDRQRSLAEALGDASFVLGFLLWVYEALAFSLPLDFHLVPAALQVVVIEIGATKLLGVLAMAAGLVVYGLALHALGSSWRLGIDREHAGALVTRGVFARSRNPVYLGLILIAAGVFLALGRLVLLLLAIGFWIYIRRVVGREERFLREHYGDAYRHYERRVGRWWTWSQPLSGPAG
jgi:protein-S-isoprenylcysteine O-methyltransferase Ste14